LSQHLGSKVTHFRVNKMPITDYVLECNNFSLGMKIRKIKRAKDTKIGILDDHFLV